MSKDAHTTTLWRKLEGDSTQEMAVLLSDKVNTCRVVLICANGTGYAAFLTAGDREWLRSALAAFENGNG
jgi:hypothetical protein